MEYKFYIVLYICILNVFLNYNKYVLTLYLHLSILVRTFRKNLKDEKSKN